MGAVLDELGIPTLELDDPLDKGEARGGRYYRRVPTGNPKKPWRYYYSASQYQRGGGAHVAGNEAAQAHERTKQGHVTLTKKELTHQLRHGNFSIVSAGRNPAHADEAKLSEDHPKFAERHEALRSELVKRGLKHTEVEGHYGGKEKSFVVFHHDQVPKDAKKAFLVHHGKHAKSEYGTIRDLGKKFNQDSVIHSHGGKHEMHFTSGAHAGEHHKGEGHKMLPHAEDYYTSAPTKRGTSKFALNFDFDKYHSHEAAMHKGLPRLFIKSGERAGHKYVSRTANAHGGYDYVYSHPETGAHHKLQTRIGVRKPGVVSVHGPESLDDPHVKAMAVHAHGDTKANPGTKYEHTSSESYKATVSASSKANAPANNIAKDPALHRAAAQAHHKAAVEAREHGHEEWAKHHDARGHEHERKAKHFENYRRAYPHEFSKKSFSKSGGEGSRGGHIIGHTREGKPIYERKEALKHVWKHTYKDFKGKGENGTKMVLAMRQGGTHSVPLDSLTDAEIKSKLPPPAHLRDAARSKASDAYAASHRAKQNNTVDNHRAAIVQHQQAAEAYHAMGDHERGQEHDDKEAFHRGKASDAEVPARNDKPASPYGSGDDKSRVHNKLRHTSHDEITKKSEEETDMLESTKELREQIKMYIHNEDPMAKGLYSFEPSFNQKEVKKLDAEYLAAYLDAFIEQAYEQEKCEGAHDLALTTVGPAQPKASESDSIRGPMPGAPNGGSEGAGGDRMADEADFYAQPIMNCLVMYLPKNQNLMAACKKVKCDKGYIADRLRVMGLVKPAFTGGTSQGDFMGGYQFSEEQTTAGIGKSLSADVTVSEEAMAKAVARTNNVFTDGDKIIELEDDSIQPLEALRNAHRARFARMEAAFDLDLGHGIVKRDGR